MNMWTVMVAKKVDTNLSPELCVLEGRDYAGNLS